MKQYYGYAENDLREIPEGYEYPKMNYWGASEQDIQQFNEDRNKFLAALSKQPPIFHNALYKPGQIVSGDEVEIGYESCCDPLSDEWHKITKEKYDSYDTCYTRLIAIEKKAEGSEIVEGNKLIALSPFSDNEIREWINEMKNPSERFLTGYLKYHRSWDCLIPVISMFEQETGDQFDWENSAYDENGVLSIVKAWHTIVDAIKQFNSQPPTNKIN